VDEEPLRKSPVKQATIYRPLLADVEEPRPLLQQIDAFEWKRQEQQ
jgi:hypothetical protein